MLKRFLCLSLAMGCLVSAALADGMILSTDWLPLGYQYAIAGANMVYANAPVPVYANRELRGDPVGSLYPEQHIHLESIDRNTGVVYIFYNENDTQTGWLFEEDCPKGWIEARFATVFTDNEPAWVVTTDKHGNRLNLRAKPSGDSVSLGKFYAGAIVRQVEPPSGGYVKVRTPHLVGYMDVRYLQQGLYTQTAELPFLTVTSTSGTSLRKMPQADSEIIQTAPYGAVVMAIAVREDDWVLVVYENETGFALGETMTPKLEY